MADISGNRKLEHVANSWSNKIELKRVANQTNLKGIFMMSVCLCPTLSVLTLSNAVCLIIQTFRWYNSKFQDGMAIVRTYHKPDLFLTMTTNPNWTEITRELLPGQSPQDRPDLVSRIFKLKKDQFIKDITTGRAFGQVVAYMWVVEWQKRGLPHIHVLLILANHDRLLTPAIVDSMADQLKIFFGPSSKLDF